MKGPIKTAIVKAIARAAGSMAAWRYQARQALRADGMARATGVEVWRGPSMIDGRPIVAVLTGLQEASTNRKTGDVLTLWIMPQDVNPSRAVYGGEDVSVCGDCRHRPSRGGSCYVIAFHSPSAIWRAWEKARYPRLPPAAVAALVDGALVRLGGWGDPAALPIGAVLPWIGSAARVVGYTHQWEKAYALPWRALCMASVDTPAERIRARAAGWRTFRVKTETQSPLTGETVCPYETRGLKCSACMACDGMSRPRARDVVVTVHGTNQKISSFTGAE
jgi:hypothetical protein